MEIVKLLSLSLSLWMVSLADLGAQEFSCAGFEGPPAPATAAAKVAVIPRASTRPIHVLVIFAQFKDETLRPVPAYAEALFDPDLPGSFAHFYRTMSSGQLAVRGTVLPKRYVSSQAAAAYLATGTGERPPFATFALEILAQVDRDIDFGRFDSDGADGIPNSGDDNGYVDYIFINMPSTPRGFIRGGATGIAGLRLRGGTFTTQDTRPDGRPIRIAGAISYGALQQEGRFDQTVGAMAHEFGHGLGLPDLYDTNYNSPSQDSAGIGHWGLMGWGAHGWNWNDGPVAFSAWSLETLGWIGVDNNRLVEVAGDTAGLWIDDVHAGGFIYRLPLGMGSKNGADFFEEYLLLEQRTRTYYNRNIPAEGLLVWHVRPGAQVNGEENYKLVDLVAADGRFQDAGYPSGLRADGVAGLDNLDFWAHDEQYAAAHSGNRGDATDPFDGIRFTRLNMQTNPSSNLLGVQSAAFTGLNLTMRRQGPSMVVDIKQPRWSGTIAEELHWTGPVLVDGDLRIAPEGTLTIYGNTQVQFAGIDHLQRGQDPERTELVVEGNFAIQLHNSAQQVTFDALNPLDPWFGILVQPASSSRIEVVENSLAVLNSSFGIQFPNAPPESQNRLIPSFQLIDIPSRETAGNGDGQLSPGETFRLDVSLDNWSLNWYKDMQIQLRWDSPLVYPTLSSRLGSEDQGQDSEPFSLYPGTRKDLQLPSLTLSPEAKPGEKIELHIQAMTGSGVLRDTLSYVVAGPPIRFNAVLDVPGRVIHNQSVVVQSGWPTSYKARVQGPVTAVDLMVRSLSDGAVVAAIPMTRRTRLGDQLVFQAAFLPNKPGAYQAFLRVHGFDGATRFGETALNLWADPRGLTAPVLVLVGDQYDDEEKATLSRILTGQIKPSGLTSQILDIASEGSAVYQTLLPHYTRDDKLVIWLGRRLEPNDQATFRAFLEGGGRLMLVSYELDRAPNISPFMRDIVHAGRLSRQRARFLPISSVDASDQLQFSALHMPLNPIAPAEILLRNNRQQAAGLRLDTGVYRLVYLPFDLPVQEESTIQALLSSGIQFLQTQGPVAVGGKYTEKLRDSRLIGNFPNPFNTQTTIAYHLSEPTKVKLTLFNMLGQPVKQLVNEAQKNGPHTVVWDGTDASGRVVSSGMYFYTLHTGGFKDIRRLLLIK